MGQENVRRLQTGVLFNCKEKSNHGVEWVELEVFILTELCLILTVMFFLKMQILDFDFFTYVYMYMKV